MSSVLFSGSCSMKGNAYSIRISKSCVCRCHSTDDEILFPTENFQSKCTSNSEYGCVNIHFQLLKSEKIDSMENDVQSMTRRVPLNKLISTEVHQSLSNDLTEIKINSVKIEENFLWKMEQIEMQMDSTSARQLDSIIHENLSKITDRPRNLLVFVNPQCGKREGKLIYEDKILPLFIQSNINVQTIFTEGVNHARDYLRENCFDDYDGIIGVGGDGFFAEICFSVLMKSAEKCHVDLDNEDIKLSRPQIRLGLIPAGSTDAFAFGTTGHNDPITSALQIITGQSNFTDVCTVHNENGFVRFMFTMLAYGFFADIIRQSEGWRVFGPARYSLSGIAQFLLNRSYRTEVTITEAEDNHSSKQLFQNLSPTSSHSSQLKLDGEYRTINCLNMPCRCEKSNYGMSPSVHAADGSFDVILLKRSWTMGLLRFLTNVATDGRTLDHSANLQRYRATKIVIKPLVKCEEHFGSWSCDGELFVGKQVTIRAHQQILPLFASGINLIQVKLINQLK